jgi:hypothetical protein
MTGAVHLMVALVAGVASQTFPRDLLVVERQDVVVVAEGRRPRLRERRRGRHDTSGASRPGPLAGGSNASGCSRCLRSGGTVEAGAVS